MALTTLKPFNPNHEEQKLFLSSLLDDRPQQIRSCSTKIIQLSFQTITQLP